MHYRYLIVITIGLSFTGCAQNSTQPITTTTTDSRLQETANDFPLHLSEQFTSDSFVLKSNGDIIQGKKNITQLYSQLFGGKNYGKTELIHKENGTESDNYFYEMGEYIFDDETFAYLCKKEIQSDGKWLKVFEAISSKTEDTTHVNDAKINTVNNCMETVVEVSKDKDNSKTIAALYWPDGYYFSKNELVKGHADIAAHWYPNILFEKLETLSGIQPQADLVFQIGRYTVPGASGLYILVWKNKGGSWKVLLDSNV